MELRRLEHANAVVITPTEDLALERVAALDDLLQKALQRDVRAVILDLSLVEHCDSGGVGVLVRAQQLARNLEKRLFLVRLRPNVRRIFRLSNLFKVFTILPSLDEALFTLQEHTVLLWENRPSVSSFYDELLIANGFVLRVAETREDVDRILCTAPPSVIILDAQEREEPKYRFARELRKGPHASIPLVIVSSYLEEEVEYQAAGATLFVSKPFRVENLIRDLRELVKERP